MTGRRVPLRARGATPRCLALLLLALAPIPGVARASIVTARAEIARPVVVRGEPIVITVTVESNGFAAASVDPPQVPGFQFERAGTSQNLVLAAGSVMRTDVFVFRVLAPGPGTYRLPPFVASLGRERVETKTSAVEVVASLPSVTTPAPGRGGADGSGAPLFARLVVDRRRVVWNEQIVARIEVYARSPLEDMPAWETPAAAGFWGEPLGSASHDRVTIEGTVYERYVRRFAFFPTRTGTLTLGPTRAIVRVASRDVTSDDPFAGTPFANFTGARFIEVPVEAAPVAITVDPLPPGAPVEFQGAVGSLSLSVSVDRGRVRAGEPITIATTVKGEGNLASARDPSLTVVPAFPSYPAGTTTELDRSGTRLHGSRRRETAFVPDHPGSLVVLPIAFSWFDPEEGRYRVQRSDSVIVRIAPSPAGAEGASALAQSATSVPAPPRGPRTGARGVPDGGPSGWSLLAGGLSAVVYAGFGGLWFARRRRARDPRRRRYARAEAAVATIERAVAGPGGAGSFEPASAALLDLASVRYGADVEGRSRRERAGILRSASVPPEEAEALERALAGIEMMAFAPPSASPPGAAGVAEAPGAVREALALARRWRDECRP